MRDVVEITKYISVVEQAREWRESEPCHPLFSNNEVPMK